MASAVTDRGLNHNASAPITKSTNTRNVDLSIFPDGHKTSGQHPPIYSALAPYSSFPNTIQGPTLWHASDYQTHPERWTHPFSPDEIDALSTAADLFIATKQPLTAISKSLFTLPPLFAASLASMRSELLNGKGFILYKNFPVTSWGANKSAVAYLGLGCHIGYPVSQNGKGHILGHVKDLGEDSTQIDKVRIYRTNARQFFHTDDADVVGLLCVAKAMEGGESDLVSAHAVWNELQATRPDVAELLTQPAWYVDRKGEVSRGQDEWIRAAVFYLETTTTTSSTDCPRVNVKWDPYYIRSLARFSSAGLVPPLSAAQEEAAHILEQTCERLKLHMVLDVGDIQFLSNAHIFHARTAYTDHAAHTGRPRRHLMRLWLSTPAAEGGWGVPFEDGREVKRGGIQVDDQMPVARVDAD